MAQEDNISTLYNALKNNGISDIGDENTFRSKLKDEGNRKSLYDALKNKGYNDIGDYGTFNDRLTSNIPSYINRPSENTVVDKTTPSVPSVSPSDLDRSIESPYVEGKGKNVKVFGVPYKDYMSMSPEQQSETYDNAINQRKEKQNEDLSSQIEGLKRDIASAKEEKGKSIQKDENLGFFSRLFSSPQQEQQAYNQAVSTPDVQHAEKKLSELDLYKRQQKDDDQGLNEFQKGVNEAGRLLPEALRSIGTFGISRIADDIKENRANKSEDNSLTQRANELYNRYTTLNKLDNSIGRDIASGTLQSAEYASQFAMTGGLASGVTEGLGKMIASKLGGKLVAKAIGGATEAIGNAVARTTVMPQTYANAVDIMNQTGAGFLDAWGQSFTQNVIENFSEMTGEVMPGFNTKNKFVREFAKRSGIQGFPQEFAEEQIATVLHAIAGDGQGKWSDLIDPRNQLMTAGVLAVMQVPHVSISSGSYVAGKTANRVQNYSINKAYNRNLDNLRSQFGGDESANSSEIVDFVNQSVNNARSSQDMDALLDFAANNKDLTDGQRDAIAKYAVAYNAKAAMDQGKKDAVTEQINAETEDIKNNSDPSNWIYTEANRITMDDKGEPISIPGYIVGHIGDTPLWKPEGSGPDAPAIPLKPHEIETVGSMPTQDVVDANSQMIQDQTKADNEREAKYDPSIPVPEQGSSFIGDDGAQYVIAQQNINGGWIADRTVIDDKGKSQTQAVEITNDDYYNAKQKELDEQENINLSDLEPENESYTDGEEIKVSDNKPKTGNLSNQEETTPIQEQQEVPVESVIYKKDAKGNDTEDVDYENMPVQNTIDHLNSITGDEERSYKSVGKTLSKANASLESAQKVLDKIENDGIDYTDKKEVAAYDKAKQAVDEAKKKATYWSSVNDEIESTRIQPGDKTAEAVKSMGEPLTGEELAAQMLADGKIPILFDSYKKETGYKNSESRKMVGLFASKRNGGMSIEQAGEQLMLADQENGTNFFDQNDPNAGRNAILDVLSQSSTRGDLFSYINKNRDAMAERERKAEYDAYNTFTQDNYHMSPEEYEAYEEALPQFLSDKSLSDDEYNEFMSNFADEQLNKNENDNTGRTGQEIASNEQGGIQADSERSGEVLPEEQPVSSQRIGKTETGSTQANASVNPSNDATQGSEQVKSDEENLPSSEENVSLSNNQVDNNENPNGQEELRSPNQEGGNEGSQSERRIVESSSRLEQDRQSNRRNVSSSRSDKPEQEKSLEEYAKENGIWLDEKTISENSSREIPFGKEANVYIDKDGKNVTKVINYSQYSSTPEDFLNNRIKLFNKLFPETAYQLEGFTRNDKGFSFVVKQPFIPGRLLSQKATSINGLIEQQNRVNQFMKDRFGMDPVGLDAVGNESYKIEDLHLKNIIEGDDGNLYVIDAIPSSKEQSSFVAPEYKGGNILDYAEQVAKQKEINDAGKEVETNPSETQKEAGNYKMGHVKVDGLDVTIENPKGSVRSGVDQNGKEWSITMNNDYGYIRGTKAVDGDHVDIFLGPDTTSPNVYVVDQVNPDGSFDESKVMYGFNSEEEARKAYLSNYEEGWQGLGKITEVSKDKFKKWVDSSTRKTKSFSEYKIAQNDSSISPDNLSSSLQEILGMPKSEADEVQQKLINGDILSGKSNPNKNSNGYQPKLLFKVIDGKIYYTYKNDFNTSQKLVLTEKSIKTKVNKDDPGAALLNLYEKDRKTKFEKEYENSVSSLLNNIASIKNKIADIVGGTKKEDYNKLNGSDKNKVDLLLKDLSNAEKKYNDASLNISSFRERPINSNKDDNKNIVGVQSNLGEGEESKQSKPIPETSKEETSGSGVLQTSEKVSDVPVMTEEEYLSSKGYGSLGIGEPALNKGKQKTAKQQNKVVENQVAKDKEYSDKREELRKEYRKKVESGELREHTTVEKLIKAANGNPELESTKAARRSLEKRGINWNNIENKGPFVNKPVQTQINWDSPSDVISSMPEREGLPRLKEGEMTAVERQMTEQKSFTLLGLPLTGSATIKTSADVAFLFKNLENASNEHVFVVLHKPNGKYSVLYLSTGSNSQSIVDFKQIAAAVNEEGATGITLVHNHPSGTLMPSQGDRDTHRKLTTIGVNVFDSVIINLDSGKFVVFNSDSDDVQDTKLPEEKVYPVKVYAFDRIKLYKPSSELTPIRSSEDIAIFLSRQKRGTVGKIQVIITDRRGRVVRYAFMDGSLERNDLVRGIIAEVGKHGDSVILASNGVIDSKSVGYIKNQLRKADITLLDSLTIKQNEDIINNYTSAYDSGLLEEKSSYEKRFRKGNESPENEKQTKSVSDVAQSLSEKLNTPVKVLNSIDELPDDVRARVEKGQRVKGWFDPKTREVVIYGPDAEGEADVNATVLHEIVGHKGLRALFGDKFDSALQDIYSSLPQKVRTEIAQTAVKSYAGDTSIATEEYLAEQAEKDETPSWWNKVVSGIKDFLRKVGINTEFTDNDVKYLLWRSRKNLERNNVLDFSEDIAMRNKFGIGEYGNRYRVEQNKEEEKPSDGTREAYEEALNEKGFTGYQAKEAYQDSMLSLKILQDTISDMDGKPIKSFENAYLAENRMSSVSTREMETYEKDYFRPLVEEVGRMVKDDGVSYREITDYLIAKHGLERNQILAERDAEKAARDSGAEVDSNDYENVYDEALNKNLERDYSGLTGLAQSYGEDEMSPTEFAQKLVSDFEGKHSTSKLWDLIHKATEKTLRKSYESGLMSRDRYEELMNRFKNYIPLRGWDETMADEVYNYLDAKRSPVNSVIKGAKGRESLADDPIATIGNMAESTILEGNRNVMKQHFLNFVSNHPSDLATIRDVWYVKDNATGEMVPSYPDIKENATPDEVAKAVDDHEEKMKELEGQGLAQRGRNGLDLQYKILPYQKSEHAVTVKRNGKEQVIYINANPRAAQALNGKTNADVEQNPGLRAIGWFNRVLAKNFTTRNPAFVLSNLSRDLIFAQSAVAIKESPLYVARFSTNVPKSISTVFKGVRGIEDNSEAGKYFQEFLNNGGETGYANLRNVDRYKKMIQKDIKHITKKDYFKFVRDGAELFSDFNRIAENISRFNAYMTSRQEGKDVVESIKDAKEITVNFNKKGSGYKSFDPKQKLYSSGNLISYSAGAMRNLFLFFNAGVQSLANFGYLAKKNAGKFGIVLGAFTSAGLMMPFINKWLMDLSGDGDDQDYYQNLTEWTRRNNLCIYIPYSKGDFVTIPLPIELRAFFGLGDMAYQATLGNEKKKGTEIAFDAINQLTELLPLNPLGNNGDITSTVLPDVLKPIWQSYQNEDFMGRPIYKSNGFNKNMPEWTKTYKGTSKMLTKLSEWTNELGGGDKYKTAPGLMNWNPAIAEHVLQGYFGGMATVLDQTGKTLYGGVETAVTGEKSDDLSFENAPVLSRFIREASDDRSAMRGIKKRFYDYLNDYEETGKNLRGYTNEVASGNLDYLDKLQKLQNSKGYKIYATFDAMKKPIDRLRKLEKEVGEDNSGEIIQQRNELIKQVVDELDKIK